MSIPINDHLPSIALVVYHQGTYIANDYAKHLKTIYWSKYTFNDIEWTAHCRQINKQGKHSYTVKVKYIHSFLLSSEMDFGIRHKCHHCNLFENSKTPHDHFLQCEISKEI